MFFENKTIGKNHQHFVTLSDSMKNMGQENKIYMFPKEPRELRTQELSLAPLFQLIIVKHYNCPKLKHQNEIEFKSFLPFLH